MKEIIPGCSNCELFTSICNSMFDRLQNKPIFAQQAIINPPGAIEGPPRPGVEGLICIYSNSPQEQINCDAFTIRTTEDDIRDMTI